MLASLQNCESVNDYQYTDACAAGVAPNTQSKRVTALQAAWVSIVGTKLLAPIFLWKLWRLCNQEKLLHLLLEDSWKAVLEQMACTRQVTRKEAVSSRRRAFFFFIFRRQWWQRIKQAGAWQPSCRAQRNWRACRRRRS